MPLFLAGLAGLGFGAFGGSQIDDIIDDSMGRNGGIPWLPILAVGGVYLYMKSR
jgi:hypothetical protein